MSIKLKVVTSTSIEEGTKIYPRGGKGKPGIATGNYRQCTLECCKGNRVDVRWPDGKLTRPCTEGLRKFKTGWKII